MNIELYEQFAEAACLNKKHDHWRKRREEGMSIAMFEIIEDCTKNFWYIPFVGIQFVGMIRWDNWYFKHYGIKKIKEVIAISAYKNVYINTGRGFDIKDLIML